MIEPMMYIGIGFLVAGLLVIGVIPLVHARAVRLTLRRLEASTPVSMAEIAAEKDQLRAEFAMTMSNIVVVPIRTGVGMRLGANVGYLKFTPTATWNPF